MFTNLAREDISGNKNVVSQVAKTFPSIDFMQEFTIALPSSKFVIWPSTRINVLTLIGLKNRILASVVTPVLFKCNVIVKAEISSSRVAMIPPWSIPLKPQ